MDSWGKVRLTLLLACLVPAGCISLSAKPELSRFFALAPLPQTRETMTRNSSGTDGPALGIGPVKMPGYLDREQLVTRVSQNRFAVAENDRWAEPLEENFSRVLGQNLSILLYTDKIITYPWEVSQRPAYQVQVEVLRFEPNAQQAVELWARWAIIDRDKKTVALRESFLTHPAKDNSSEASVAALSEVLGSFSQEIATTIRGLSSGQSG
jgi:uncharacterized protein